MAKLIFNQHNNAFFQSLKSSVDDYFAKSDIKKTGNWRLYYKAILLLSLHMGIYVALVSADMSQMVAIALCCLMGVVGAAVGFNVMHDANHGSFSTNGSLNEALGLTANYLGISSFLWKQKHNVIHHSYPNADGIDDDIAKSPAIRQCDTQKWVPAHRFQHIYIILVYGLSSIFWIFMMDPTKYFSKKINTTQAWKMSFRNHAIFWSTKVIYVAIYMVLPGLVWGWQAWLVGWLAMNFAQGTVLSFVFQLAHVVEKTDFEYIPLDTAKHIDSAFAEYQLRTTSNFAMENRFISWITGGLNYQVEHHLFPKISHVHYPAISKIIRAKCAEFSIPYNYYNGMTEALSSHFRLMKRLGEKPTGAHIEGQDRPHEAVEPASRAVA